MQDSNRKIIVITPIKNESWILTEFLSATSLYADHIIVSDHSSTDDSVQIAESFPKAIVIKTKFEKFAESERRDELLIAARNHGANNLILSLDADEFLTPELVTPKHLEYLKNQPIGTRLHVPLWNVRPGFKKYWSPGLTPIGFIDDGSNHPGKDAIHFPRIPQKSGAPSLELSQGGLLHLQFIQWDRMTSKHRWYRVWETINFPKKSAVEIFRRYDHMNILPKSAFLDLDHRHIALYKEKGVDLESLEHADKLFWWDAEVEKLVAKHGIKLFRYLDLKGLVTIAPMRISISVVIFRMYLFITSPLHRHSYLFLLRLALIVLDKAFGRFFVPGHREFSKD